MTTSPLTEQQLNATIYDALAAFTGVACWNVLQYAQNRQYLAEHLTEALAPLLLAEVRRLQDRVTELEAVKPALCGRTRDIGGAEYGPCNRQAGHGEAYCRSERGTAYFLAVDADQPKPAAPAV